MVPKDGHPKLREAGGGGGEVKAAASGSSRFLAQQRKCLLALHNHGFRFRRGTGCLRGSAAIAFPAPGSVPGCFQAARKAQGESLKGSCSAPHLTVALCCAGSSWSSALLQRSLWVPAFRLQCWESPRQFFHLSAFTSSLPQSSPFSFVSLCHPYPERHLGVPFGAALLLFQDAVTVPSEHALPMFPSKLP